MGTIINALLGLMVCSAFFQPTRDRTRVVFVLIVLIALFDRIGPILGDVEYYVGAAFTDGMIITGIALVRSTSFTSKWLIRLSWASMVGNALGFYLWFNYYPATVYNVLFVIIYSAMLLVFIKGNIDYVRSDPVANWHRVFHTDRPADIQHSTEHRSEQ